MVSANDVLVFFLLYRTFSVRVTKLINYLEIKLLIIANNFHHQAADDQGEEAGPQILEYSMHRTITILQLKIVLKNMTLFKCL